MKMFSERNVSKKLTGAGIVLLTACYLLATGAVAQKAEKLVENVNITYKKDYLSYGNVWAFDSETHGASRYSQTVNQAEKLTWYTGANTDNTEASGYNTRYFEKIEIGTDYQSVIDANTKPMAYIDFAKFRSNIVVNENDAIDSVISATVNNIEGVPDIHVVKADATKGDYGIYSVVPDKAGLYHVYAYRENTEVDTIESIAVQYALLNSCGATNDYAEKGFEGESAKELPLNRISGTNWYHGTVPVDVVNWYAVNVLDPKTTVNDKQETAVNGGVSGVKTGGEDNNNLTLTGTGDSTPYYYNKWEVGQAYYNTVLVIQFPATVALGPITSEGKLTLENSDSNAGELKAWTILGEEIAVSPDEQILPNLPIILSCDISGNKVFSGYTSGDGEAIPVYEENAEDKSNTLKTLEEKKSHLYFFEGGAESAKISLTWANPAQLPKVKVSGDAGIYDFFDNKEGKTTFERGTLTERTITLDFTDAVSEDYGEIKYEVTGDLVDGVSYRTGTLTSSERTVSVLMKYGETTVTISVEDKKNNDIKYFTYLFEADESKLTPVAQNGNVQYSYLEDALSQSDSGQINILTDVGFQSATDGTHTVLDSSWMVKNDQEDLAGYTIKSGVTLLVPYNTEYTLCTTKPTLINSYPQQPTKFRQLTVPDGITLVVRGALSVSAQQSSAMHSNGSPTGPVGFVEMQGGSNITVKNGGNLYVWGYIVGPDYDKNAQNERPESGTIIVEKGGTVYECFQVADWRGGNATLSMNENEQKVFPISQYYVQNVQIPMTFFAGANEKGYLSVSATGAENQGAAAPFIGDGGLFTITSGTLTKDYDEERDRLIVDVNGDLTLDSLSITLKLSFLGSTKTIDSSKYVLPLTNNIILNVHSGTVTISQDVAILPGVEINIAEGATCSVAKDVNVFVYDADEWTGYCSEYDSQFIALKYAYNRTYNRTAAADMMDAKILVNGTLDASSAYLYTTKGNAAICGEKTSGKIHLNPGNETATYQMKQEGNTLEEWVSIAVNPARLRHADGTYMATGKDTYTYDGSRWICTNHSYDAGVETAPTCTVAGYTTYTCLACGNSYTTNEVPALGHSSNCEHTVATIGDKYYTTLESALEDVKVNEIIAVEQDDVAKTVFVQSKDAGCFMRCGTAGSYTYEPFTLTMTHWYVEAYLNKETALIGFGGDFSGPNKAQDIITDVGFRVNGTPVWATDETETSAEGTEDWERPAGTVETELNTNTIYALIKVGDEVYQSETSVSFKISDYLAKYSKDKEGAEIAAQLADDWAKKDETSTEEEQ